MKKKIFALFFLIIILFSCRSKIDNKIIQDINDTLSYGHYIEIPDEINELNKKYTNKVLIVNYKHLIKTTYNKLNKENNDEILSYHLLFSRIGFFCSKKDLRFIKRYYVKKNNGDLFLAFLYCKINYNYDKNFNVLINYLTKKPANDNNLWAANLLVLLGDKKAIKFLEIADGLIWGKFGHESDVARLSISLIKYLNGEFKSINDIWTDVYGEGF